ncbi:MAG: DegT/DnrJ/EryC1/StrS family aminotransferase [Planctomycetales bacterium]
MPVPAFDYLRGYRARHDEFDAAIRRALESGRLILGPEVEAFEREFAAYVGAKHAVGLASGTDALVLALRALDLGPGDEVITVANTAVATVAAIRAVGAVPRFVDVRDDTLLMDVSQLAAAIGPRAKCLLPVHLFGQPVEMDALCAVAREHGLPIVEDCAQAHGARWRERHVGTFGTIGCFSFYPTKNLGGFGDGGMCVTDDEFLAARIRAQRMYGFCGDGIAHQEGLNSRLDELQAAVLRVRLAHLDEALAARRAIADCYRRELARAPYRLPADRAAARDACHLFVIRTDRRDAVTTALARAGVGYGIHYPVPIHRMPAYSFLDVPPGSLPVTERAAFEILSLPMFPELREDELGEVLLALRGA